MKGMTFKNCALIAAIPPYDTELDTRSTLTGYVWVMGTGQQPADWDNRTYRDLRNGFIDKAMGTTLWI